MADLNELYVMVLLIIILIVSFILLAIIDKKTKIGDKKVRIIMNINNIEEKKFLICEDCIEKMRNLILVNRRNDA